MRLKTIVGSPPLAGMIYTFALVLREMYASRPEDLCSKEKTKMHVLLFLETVALMASHRRLLLSLPSTNLADSRFDGSQGSLRGSRAPMVMGVMRTRVLEGRILTFLFGANTKQIP